MYTKLKDISIIQTGFFGKTCPEGDVVYLQSKHFDENGTFDASFYPDLELNHQIKKHLLQPNDILFAAKGSKNFAALYEEDNPAAVASTTFFIIRLHKEVSNKILPYFLVWFLNQAKTLKFLKNKAIGTSISSISKTVLDDLDIPIPTISTQQKILEIDRFRKIEKEIKSKIENLQEIQIQQQIINALKSK